jgi:IS30 family transposase
MSEKHKSTSPSTIQVKNWQEAISSKEKLDVISWLEKGEWIVDICHNVRLTYSSVHTVCDNADRVTESAKSGTKVNV